MKVLLSIKPEFAYKIFEGTKRFEFRKAIFKNSKIKSVVVYASSPVQKVIGEFEIDEILNDEPDKLWKKTHKYSGISKDYFDEYFLDRELGYAIKIKTTCIYKTPLNLIQDFGISVPPQSFMYLNK
jgi:predicted transcriptional regulator